MFDANMEENETSQDSSLETNTDAQEDSDIESQDGESGEVSDNFQKRFNQVYGELQSTKRRIAELENQRTTPTEFETEEPKTWQEAQEAIKVMLKDEQKKEDAQIATLENEINAEIKTILSKDKTFSANDIWEYMEKKGIENPHKAYIEMLYNEKPDNSQSKAVSSKIGKSSQNAAVKGGISYSELHRKSLDEI